MTTTRRFGNKLRLPSTHAIKTELKEIIALEEGRVAHALANNLPADASWAVIGSHLAAKERVAHHGTN